MFKLRCSLSVALNRLRESVPVAMFNICALVNQRLDDVNSTWCEADYSQSSFTFNAPITQHLCLLVFTCCAFQSEFSTISSGCHTASSTRPLSPTNKAATVYTSLALTACSNHVFNGQPLVVSVSSCRSPDLEHFARICHSNEPDADVV